MADTVEEITDTMLAYWTNTDGIIKAEPQTYNPPPGQEDWVRVCAAVDTFIKIADGEDDVEAYAIKVVRVPWKLTTEELSDLARGGTLWLSITGGLAPHQIEVAAP